MAIIITRVEMVIRAGTMVTALPRATPEHILTTVIREITEARGIFVIILITQIQTVFRTAQHQVTTGIM